MHTSNHVDVPVVVKQEPVDDRVLLDALTSIGEEVHAPPSEGTAIPMEAVETKPSLVDFLRSALDAGVAAQARERELASARSLSICARSSSHDLRSSTCSRRQCVTRPYSKRAFLTVVLVLRFGLRLHQFSAQLYISPESNPKHSAWGSAHSPCADRSACCRLLVSAVGSVARSCLSCAPADECK